MGLIWNDYKKDFNAKEGLDAEAIFLTFMSETWKHDTTNAKLFPDPYNWYTCGIEDGMYQFFEFEFRTAKSLKGLGSIIKKYLGEIAFDIFQKCILQLMPLVNSNTPDSAAIDEISESMNAYFKKNELDLLHGIKKYLLAEGDNVAEEIGW